MGHQMDIRRTDYGHLPALVRELAQAHIAYEDAEKAFQKELDRRRAHRVLPVRVRVERRA